METPFEKRIEILTDLYDNHLDRYPELTEFVKWHDLGFPFAWASTKGYAVLTDKGIELVNKTFENLLEHEKKSDVGFEDLDGLLGVEYEDKTDLL